MAFDLQLVYERFPDLSEDQRKQFAHFAELIADWNGKINVVSRTDIENLPRRHILHSLAIARVLEFKPGSRILDVGTGGGFPGIPLAILFPKSKFQLVDSIGKKIKVASDCIEQLGLANASAAQMRAEQVKGRFDFVVARAVTQLPKFMNWIRDKIHPQNRHEMHNGVLYLKGGDLKEEFASVREKPKAYPIRDYFDHEEFYEKFVVHVPVKSKSRKK